MHIAFPGCFNPPTYTHFAIAQYVAETFPGSKIIFIPVSDKYSKWRLSPVNHRLEMLKLIHNPNIIISDVEAHLTIQPKTIDTLNKINYPNLRLLIGSDNLLKLKTWSRYEELITKYKPIIVERGHDDARKMIDQNYPKYKNYFHVIRGIIHSDDSSTFVRDNMKKGFDCKYYLPNEIIAYIKKHHLYEKNNKRD